MNGRIRFCGSRVLKRYSSGVLADAATRRAEQARACGVTTPSATRLKRGRLVVFPLISGVSGRDAVDASGMGVIAALLSPVAKLHAMTLCDDLPAFDPMAKTTPRLRTGAERQLPPLLADARETVGRGPVPSCVIHGDLHAGQLLVDDRGVAWLLDLDDMALGDPAADLGNFAAHLATSEAALARPVLEGMRHILSLTLRAYAHAGGNADAAQADAYGRLALLRRAVKLRERGSAGLLQTLYRECGG